MKWPWVFKMAWRDSRSNRRKLFLYMAAIIVGVAAQVAITSFRVNLNQSITDQSKELLGADLEVERNAPLQPEVQAYLDEISAYQSRMLGFTSMALFPKTGATRLSQISAMEDGFPFYGEIETNPPGAADIYLENYGALVEETTLLQLGLEPGDSVKVGHLTYEITGAIIDIPGQSMANSFFGPRILIPFEGVEETGLMERGSRLEHKTYVELYDGRDPASIRAKLDILNDTYDFRFDDVAERQEEVGEAITQLSNFLNLIGFIALLLGGIGIASSIFVYIRQKINTVAVLRCVGASSNQAMAIYLIQAAAMGFVGATLGAILGAAIQLYLPVLVQDFVPFDIELFVAWGSIFTGIFTGVAISIVFALFPLLAVRKISPLFTLRSAEVNLGRLLSITSRIALYGLVGVSVTAYAWLMLNDLVGAIFFTGGLVVCLLLLAGFAVLVMKAARKFMPSGWSYEWRQGLSNLYRPNNQTSTLLLTFGLGVTLISSLYLTQDMLLGTISFQGDENLPNLAMYDIQYDQNDGVNEIARSNGMEILQNVPIVTMRIQSLKNQPVDSILADTSRNARRWALTREYRSTYRDSLLEDDNIVEGEFIGQYSDMSKPVPVSITDDLLRDLNVALGDTIVWDVQGIPIETYISSVRKVDWARPQPNFFFVFPSGILEPAPQFFATTLQSPSRERSIAFQQEVVQAYPNVSAIDIGQVINTIRDFLDRVTFVIQFIGLFSIITGLIVLAGSAATSRFQRIREAVLLRTLGAKQKQVVKIQVIEYVLLGIMASLIGLLLSVGTSTLLGNFYFDIEFTPNFTILITEVVLLVLLVLVIGLLNTRGIHKKPPLEILRAEG